MTHCHRYKLMIKPAQVLAPTRSWPSGMLQKPCWPCLATTNPLPSLPNLPSSRPVIRRSVLLQSYSLSMEITVQSLEFMRAHFLWIFRVVPNPHHSQIYLLFELWIMTQNQLDQVDQQKFACMILMIPQYSTTIWVL